MAKSITKPTAIQLHMWTENSSVPLIASTYQLVHQLASLSSNLYTWEILKVNVMAMFTQE